jgi:hypothetical protein
MGFQFREIQIRAQSANNPSDLRVLEFREEKSCPPNPSDNPEEKNPLPSSARKKY